MALSLVRIKGPHCKQSVKGKYIFAHCSVTVNLGLPMLCSNACQNSANKRIKSMWLEAKSEWCNQMLVSIWWSEDGGWLGKETVASCALDVRLATISRFPTSASFFLSHICSALNFLSGCETLTELRNGEDVQVLCFELCLLPSWPCHTSARICTYDELDPGGLSLWSQYDVLILNKIKSDFRAVVSTAASMLLKLHFACRLSVLWRKLTFCSHLYWYGL